MIRKEFSKMLDDSVKAKKSISKILNKVEKSIHLLTSCILKGNKILICGNGGSAADAQHLAAEFLVRLRPKVNRKSLPVIPLATDMSTVTACGNDYNFSQIFARTLSGIGQKDDILICISTSGMSKNIINVLNQAKKQEIKSISFLGNTGGIAKKKSDLSLIIGSKNVARIQEAHIFLGHFILQKVEENILKKNF